MRRHRRQGGYTLIEMAIAATLLSLTFGGIAMATQRGLFLFRQSVASSTANTASARSINRIARELAFAGRETLDPTLETPPGQPRVWDSTLEFRPPLDYVAGSTVFGTPMQLVLELEPGELPNGLDDNGNGLVDEGRVVRIEAPGTGNERRLVLIRSVAALLEGELFNGLDDNGNGLVDESGFCITRDEDRLTVRLTLQHLGPEESVITRTQSIEIGMRN